MQTKQQHTANEEQNKNECVKWTTKKRLNETVASEKEPERETYEKMPSLIQILWSFLNN